ncbi:MAG TPA: hypothetical protein VHQ47_20875 [Phycisphaerae bacterium]|jgi:hypothetical protein|nr:hypothetical protein [Phycisphaerae bacterium]HWB98949.1 hypothetical protein [Bryobacteraceae bacterium]
MPPPRDGRPQSLPPDDPTNGPNIEAPMPCIVCAAPTRRRGHYMLADNQCEAADATVGNRAPENVWCLEYPYCQDHPWQHPLNTRPDIVAALCTAYCLPAPDHSAGRMPVAGMVSTNPPEKTT